MTINKIYNYKDDKNKLVYQIVRSEPKEFKVRRPDGRGGWKWSIEGIPLIPYNLHNVLKGNSVFIVEGEKDVDSLRDIGIVGSCNPFGAGKWKPEYNKFFKEKEIIIIPDNDTTGKNHAEDVAKNLCSVAKSVKIVELPELQEKWDVSDWIEQRRQERRDSKDIKASLLRIVHNTTQYSLPQREITPEQRQEETYFVNNNGYLMKWKRTKEGYVTVPIANFDARITEEITEDDGQEQTHKYIIEGEASGTILRKIEVPANQFNSLSWIFNWGNLTIIEPGQTNKDCVRHAIQIRSNNINHSVVYSHTGWKKVDGEWIYLSGNGAIGAEGIAVSLSRELERYSLPQRTDNEIEAIKASLSFLEIAQRDISLPLFAFLYLSPLTTILNPAPNFSGYIYGDTGTFKSTVAILLLSHFGDFSSVTKLQNFEDTANAVEKRAFVLKDTLMLLDDYHPSYTNIEARQKESLAQRIIRAFSNRTGRGRLNKDTTDKGRYEPRGMLLVTGEELVTLSSTLARVMVIELSKGDISQKKLSAMQAKAGLLPHAMTSYILWIKEHIDIIKSNFPQEFHELRNMADQSGTHRKLPEQSAFLQYALQTVISWMVDKTVLNEREGEALLKEGWNIFIELSRKHSNRIDKEDPVKQFIEILSTLITQGRVKLQNRHDIRNIVGNDNCELIGYFDDLNVYLLPVAIWSVVNKYCKAEGSHFPFKKNTFFNMLIKRRFIEPDGKRSSINLHVNGGKQRVLKFTDKALFISAKCTEDDCEMEAEINKKIDSMRNK